MVINMQDPSVRTEEPAPTEYFVAPGVTLTVCPTARFKVGYFSLYMTVPLNREQAPAYSLMLSVLQRGTERFPDMACLNRRLDTLYATAYHPYNCALGESQCIGFRADILEQECVPEDINLLYGTLEIMTQMLFHPLTDEDGLLAEKYLCSEKQNTVDAIRSLANQPGVYASVCFSEKFYEDEQRGHLLCGTEEQVMAETREHLTALWRSLSQNAPIRCFYVGQLPPQTVVHLLRDHLSGERAWRQELLNRDCENGCPSRLPPPILPRGPLAKVEQCMDAGQSHLILGIHTGITVGMPGFYAMMLCHEILGSSPVSRLFVYVREQGGLCYSCSSDYAIDCGDIIIRCAVHASRREAVQEAILAQLSALKNGEFTEAEWRAAQKSLDGSYRRITDSTKMLTGFYELRKHFGLDETISACRRRLSEVTREEVIAAAQKLEPSMIYFMRGTATLSGDETTDDGNFENRAECENDEDGGLYDA